MSLTRVSADPPALRAALDAFMAELPLNLEGLICAVCDEHVFASPAGPMCAQGHVDPAPDAALSALFDGDPTLVHMTPGQRAAFDLIVQRARSGDRVDSDARDYPLIWGRKCGECDTAVYRTPGGAACASGHGGVDVEGTPKDWDQAKGRAYATNLEAAERFDADEDDEVEPAPALDLFVPADQLAVLDADARWYPSLDQSEALDVLIAALAHVDQPDASGARPAGMLAFTGAAGCGKTTVVKALLRRLNPATWSTLMIAPTWRAANRLREVTGLPAASVHSTIYGSPKMMRFCPCGQWSAGLAAAVEGEEKQQVEINGVMETVTVVTGSYTCEHCKRVLRDVTLLPQELRFEVRASETEKPRRLVVLDEASMCNTEETKKDIVRALLSDRHTFVLLVGDINQLEAVQNAEERKKAADPFGLRTPTAKLTTVHRQGEGDPILTLAHRHKTDPAPVCGDWPFGFSEPGIDIQRQIPLDAAAWWAAQHRQGYRDAALIVFSNGTRAKLNEKIRGYTGALTVAAETDCGLIVGDRLLLRGNGGGCFNGEVWTVGRIWRIQPGTQLLDASSRVRGGRTSYEVEQVLGRGPIGVWQAWVEQGGAWKLVTLVLPLDAAGRGMLETDLILRAGMKAEEARQLCREIARAWRDEAKAAYAARDPEWVAARQAKQARTQMEPMWLLAMDRGDAKQAARFLTGLIRDSYAGDKAETKNKLAASTPEERPALLRLLDSPHDVAAKHEGVEGYLNERFGAVLLGSVVVADYGEALTCYAMQGSQAAHVGVVADGPFWGAWRNDKLGALRWLYTAETRAQTKLSIFQIKKET